MATHHSELASLLHKHFNDADSIAELRERLRDAEEELHAVFADELSRHVKEEELSHRKQA
ncbi:hypothetical protein [Ferrimonas gelatinilytica]|uniref:Uncharacterized protein n=1 Tax=Ferrimonas gelatinilytica TaxID=1255257 RepID=A0ABP9RXD7_9GAMM